MRDDVVIVGASLAGLRTAEALRRGGFAGRISVIGDEPHMPYDRPPLSKEVLTGERGHEECALPTAEGLDVEWLLGRRATALDIGRRTVRTDGGDVRFGKLVIATGVRPRTLPLFDTGADNVFTLRSLDDAVTLRTELERRPKVLIVGAGFIGVEVASSAAKLGCEVTLVSPDPPVAPAGPDASQVCRRLLADGGCVLHEGRVIRGLGGGRTPDVATLDDGTKVPFDIAVVAVGAAPNTEWLVGSGLDVENGVRCDASLTAAGAEDIVAAGDVARWPNALFGTEPMRIEHWANAVEHGAAAARTLLEGPTAHTSVPSFWSDHFGIRLQAIGLPRLGDRTELLDGDVAEGRFAQAFYAGDRLVGAVTYGMPRAIARCRARLARPEPAEETVGA